MSVTLATGRLTLAALKRLLRDPSIVRSLAFPTLIVAGTLLLTVGGIALYRESAVIGLTPSVWSEPALREAIAAEGFDVAQVDAPRAEVASGRAWAGTDGHTLWVSSISPRSLRVEAILRRRVGADWVPEAIDAQQNAPAVRAAGVRAVRAMALLYALYGCIFGAATLVRDREEGTLDAERTLPVPARALAFARWLGGSLALGLFLALSIALVQSLLGVEGPATELRHALAAAAGSAAIGLAAATIYEHRAGLSAPLALAMTLVTAVLGLAAIAPGLAAWLPIASLGSGGDGWAPLAGALALGVLASELFHLRQGRR